MIVILLIIHNACFTFFAILEDLIHQFLQDIARTSNISLIKCSRGNHSESIDTVVVWSVETIIILLL